MFLFIIILLLIIIFYFNTFSKINKIDHFKSKHKKSKRKLNKYKGSNKPKLNKYKGSNKNRNKNKDKDKDKGIDSIDIDKSGIDNQQWQDYDDNELKETANNDNNYQMKYNIKKYYCNSYSKHKQIYSDTPSKMKLDKHMYYFKDDDICCTNKNPKLNFKYKYITCCHLQNNISGIKKCTPTNLK
jgi:hypothetical protein